MIELYQLPKSNEWPFFIEQLREEAKMVLGEYYLLETCNAKEIGMEAFANKKAYDRLMIIIDELEHLIIDEETNTKRDFE